jgi:TonB family protein
MIKTGVNKSISNGFVMLTIRVFLTLLSFLSISHLHAQEIIHAQPYGGSFQLRDFIKEEMIYPENDFQNKVQGDVNVEISIDKEGKVQSIKVVRSASHAIDTEAVRILRKVLWQPAQYMGKNIWDTQTLTIRFDVKKYNRYCAERGYTKIIYPREPVDESNAIYTFKQVDTVPKLIFADKAMTLGTFINQQIHYPEDALKYNITGKETITFIVEPSGRISNIQPLEYTGAGCWEESVRLIKLLRWYPGIKDNKAVRVSMSISITFNLSNETGVKYVPAQLNNSMQ